MEIFIESDRILLREIMEWDVEDFYELDSDPEVHRYLGNTPITHIDQASATIKDIRGQYNERGIGRLAIIDKRSLEFIGWSGLKLERNLRPEREYYDIGYRLKQKFWGRGYATEAAELSLKYAFEDRKLEKIGAAAEVDHVVSNHILQKIGMTPSGTFEYKEFTLNWYEMGKEDYLKKY